VHPLAHEVNVYLNQDVPSKTNERERRVRHRLGSSCARKCTTSVKATMAEVLERGDIYFVVRPKVEHTSAEGSKTSNASFNDLRMERTAHPLKPLFEGRWE